MSDFPVGRTSLPFFRPADDGTLRRPSAELTPNTCRWCLERFDPQRQQPRTIWERGQLRTRLKMADNGSELIICDNCWSGAMGQASFLHGQAVPCMDPEIVPNPSLASLLEG